MARFGPYRYEYELGKRDYTLKAQVDEIISKTEKRMNAVMRESIQRTVDDAQLVGPSVASVKAAISTGLGSEGRGKKKMQRQGPITAPGKGGRMRVDTGFLRASGQSSLNGMPTGPQRGEPDGKYDWNAGQTETTLAGMDFGATFFFGWTANYAKYREAFDGFLIGAVQKWPQTVAAVVEEVKKRIA